MRVRVLDHFEDVDVVVNNAGACLTGTFSATAVEDFRAQMDVVSMLSSTACVAVFMPFICTRPILLASKQQLCLKSDWLSQLCDASGPTMPAMGFLRRSISEALTRHTKRLLESQI